MTVTSSSAAYATPNASKPTTPLAPSAPLSGPAAVLDLSPDAQKLLGRSNNNNVPWGNSPAKD